MRKTALFSILLLLSIAKANAQEWLLGSTRFSTYTLGSVPAPGTVFGTLGFWSGMQYTGSDEVPAVDGASIGFYIRNGDVYDYNGNLAFTLPHYLSPGDFCTDGSMLGGISGEVAIVRKPGSSKDYYVIYEKDFGFCGGSGHANLVYVLIHMEFNTSLGNYLPELQAGGEDYPGCAGCGTPILGKNPLKLHATYSGVRSTISFAVSRPINASGNRYIYSCAKSSIKRFIISNSGITFDQDILSTGTTIGGYTLTDCDFYTHNLILSPDEHFLAWAVDFSHPFSTGCTTSTKGVYIMPLMNGKTYDEFSLTRELVKLPSGSDMGGICFTPDSRKIYFTNNSGLNWAQAYSTDPISFSTSSLLATTSNFKKSFLNLGGNNQMFGIETTTSATNLACFDVLGTNTKTLSGLAVPSNDANNYNSNYRLPKNVVGANTGFRVSVDISTLCKPGSSTPAVNPVMTVLPNVVSYVYNWYPLPGNTTVLDDYHSATPQILSSTPTGGGADIAYYYLTVMNGTNYASEVATFIVRYNLVTSGYDLVSKDSYVDLYNEPNDQLARTGDDNIWESADIWNRNAEDGDIIFDHQPPIYHSVTHGPNFLYTRVKNIGCIASPATGASVKLYWTAAGGPETWSNIVGQNFWTDKLFAGFLGFPPHGLNVADIALPAINPGTSVVEHSSWAAPNPADYAVDATTPSSVELCFLSRIVDGHNAGATDGMSIQELYTGTIRANITNNNNIVTRNTGVLTVADKHIVKGHVLTVGNAESVATNFSVLLANDRDLLGGVSTLSHYAHIKVSLGNLFPIWYLAGAHGTYAAINANEKSVTFDCSAMMRLDSILLDTATEYPIVITPYLLDSVNVDSIPNETIRFKQLLGNQIYGCFNFRLAPEPTHSGVLAMTEVSNGPSGDCEYAEMIVANCGSDSSSSVDIRGWIVDDNSGNFNTSGCATGVGIAQGHYRLAFDNIWRNVPVGSMLVMYNHDANCYNLADTFRVDTTATGLVYWIPIGGTVAAPFGTPHVERFGAKPSSSICSYCADAGTTAYTTAAAWGNTIGLSNTSDAMQVRCPGCNSTYGGTPAFYHGIGYGPATGTNAFVSITAGTNDLGGAVINGTGGGYKYVFTGDDRSDLGNPLMWSRITADAAGTAPSTLGSVTSAFMAAATGHQLALPCCGTTADKRTPSAAAIDAPSAIKVYPNPADATVYFEFPKSTDATIKLMDITGRIIDQIHIQDNTMATFNVKGYVPGLYIYQVITEGKTQSGKLQVK